MDGPQKNSKGIPPREERGDGEFVEEGNRNIILHGVVVVVN